MGRLTRRGRLRNQWAAALAEPDPARRQRLLLDLQPEFSAHAKSLAPLWPPYVHSVLATGWLTSDDLGDLEARGAMVADGSRGRLSLADAWSPLIAARDHRGEHAIANDRIAALYWWSGLPEAERAAVARQLARRGADGPNFRSVYVNHLSNSTPPAAEPEMAAILASALVVGFGVERSQLVAASELAAGLREAGVTLPRIDLALGMRALLVEDDPKTAALALESSWKRDRDDVSLAGLVSAWLRVGAHDRIAAVVPQQNVPRVVAELAELSAVLRWLDDAEVAGLCPANAARLAELKLAVEAGEWLDYAIARAHLLEGDALGAARIMVPLADSHPDRPDWNYHAAWALLLTGDRDGVAARFDAAAGSAQRWAVGLLLMEADPGAADEVVTKITDDGLSPAAGIVTARASLIHSGSAPPLPDHEDGDSVTASMERVRGGVAAGLAAPNSNDTKKWLHDKWFTRLPLADQLVWAGLGYFETGLLRHAADGLGYQRAALVLSVHTADPSRLGRLSQRSDPTIELLRAWAEPDTADARLTALLARDERRAHYARGQLLLTTADFAAAAEEFRAAAKQGDRVPRDAALAWRAAACAAGASDDTRATGWWWHLRWDGDGAPAWLSWAAALLTLDDTTATGQVAGRHLVTVLTRADAPSTAAIQGAAAAMAKACLTASDPNRAVALAALLDELAAVTGHPEALRMRQLAAAGLARGSDAALELTVTDGPTALVVAEHALAGGDTDLAVQALRAAESEFCGLAAAVLAGTAGALPELGPQIGLATRLLVAAAQAAENPALAVQTLAPVLREHDLTGIVDLRNVLTHLRAGLSSRRVPEHLRQLVRQVAPSLDPLAAARHLTGIGDHEAADPLWRKAINQPDGTARTEYAAVLCHRAVLARRQGDDLLAAGHLLLAARVAETTTPQFKLLPGREVTGFRVTDRRGAKRDKNLDATEAALVDARAQGNEMLMLLCVERLRAHRRDGAPSESHLVVRAEQLVLSTCVNRLFQYQFPGDGTREHHGRHHLLERALSGDGDVLFALLDENRHGALAAWDRFLPERGVALPLRHTLAVVHRERALATPDAAAALVTATLLWSRLLSTEDFWAGMSEAIRGDERRLRTEVMRELLSEHSVRGQRALAAKDKTTAKAHLRCLVECAGDGMAVDEALTRAHLPIPVPDDPKRFADVAAVAKEALDGWVGDLLDAARAAADDPKAIAAQPKGIRRDYKSGIEVLRPFLGLGIPVRAVLLTGLGWYNDWRSDLGHRGDWDDQAEVGVAATPLADDLESLCGKEKMLDVANQAISRHHMFLGTPLEDQAKSISSYEQALDWNPGNTDAERLLTKSLLARARQRVRKGSTSAARADLRRALDSNPPPGVRADVEAELVNIETTSVLLDLAKALYSDQWDTVEDIVRDRTTDVNAAEVAVLLNKRATAMANEVINALPSRTRTTKLARSHTLLKDASRLDPANTTIQRNLNGVSRRL
ncbi:hypothetical protein [Kutzneria sp. CA-103260]|uniref:hypothetical protein n=1 Tax=Kutzneria sp. CA-103260 TaxID=2802641 RepID=UPI001BA9FA8A|nr:hypothetical protein [Kutzneria sp. CA-103260]